LGSNHGQGHAGFEALAGLGHDFNDLAVVVAGDGLVAAELFGELGNSGLGVFNFFLALGGGSAVLLGLGSGAGVEILDLGLEVGDAAEVVEVVALGFGVAQI
jgi:hypothetical protein